MTTKIKIAKFLIVFGFLLSIVNYCVELADFYNCNDQLSFVLEEAENSEQHENETPEKDDHKEKDKISQFGSENGTALVASGKVHFHFIFVDNTLVYLENNTPPPEFS